MGRLTVVDSTRVYLEVCHRAALPPKRPVVVVELRKVPVDVVVVVVVRLRMTVRLLWRAIPRSILMLFGLVWFGLEEDPEKRNDELVARRVWSEARVYSLFCCCCGQPCKNVCDDALLLDIFPQEDGLI